MSELGTQRLEFSKNKQIGHEAFEENNLILGRKFVCCVISMKNRGEDFKVFVILIVSRFQWLGLFRDCYWVPYRVTKGIP